MMDRFYEIRECYRFYCAAGGNAFGLSATGFVDLMRQSRLIDGFAGSGSDSSAKTSSSSSSHSTAQRQIAVTSKRSTKIVRFQKTEAENVYITMKGYSKKLRKRMKKKIEEGSLGDEMTGEDVMRNTGKDHMLTLGVFMETLLRCALIKFGHGTPSKENEHDDEKHMEHLDTPHHHHHHHHHHHNHHHHHHHHDHHKEAAAEEEQHDPSHFFQGAVDEDAMSIETALEHLLDDYVIAHGASSNSTAFRTLFFYFPEVEDVFVDYFGVISESYLHLCYDSEMNLKHSSHGSSKGKNPTVHQLDQLGASASSFVDMLYKAGIYSKTKVKLRRLYLLISQSKQAWDWKGTNSQDPSTMKIQTVDDAVVQYERISFAEYVELVGRLALQLAHDKAKLNSARKRIGRANTKNDDETKNETKVETKDEIKDGTKEVIKDGQKTITETTKKSAFHESLQLNRDHFLDELPSLMESLKTYMYNVNESLKGEAGSNLNKLLKRSNAAVRASRRKSVVAVMKTVKSRLIAREEVHVAE